MAQDHQVIPAEAVEAAAAHMHDDEGYFETFEDAPEFRKAHFREKAAGILKAAAPHMLRTVLDDVYGKGWDAARGEPETPNQEEADA